MDTTNLLLGLQATGYGLGGVFLVLILFYIITKLMLVFSNRKANAK